MFFTFENIRRNGDLEKSWIILEARKRILLYPFGSNEIMLDNYLIKKYNINLKQACLKLLSNISMNSNKNNDIILTFKEDRYNDLATLITYGNELVQGSKILKLAFKDFEKEIRNGR